MSDLPIHGQPVLLFAEVCERGAQSEENRDTILNVRIHLGDLLLVAGGIGENGGGAMASRMAVEHFYAHLAALPRGYPAEDALREAAARANTNILGAARVYGSQHPGMGASVVAALLQEEGEITYAWIGHLGDCRAYLLRANRLQRITFDHSAVQELLNCKAITQNEAVGHPEAGVLTRYLGQRTGVDFEIDHLPLAIGDTLLLCSNGLWNTLPELEMETLAGGVTVEGSAQKLLEQVFSIAGSQDIAIEMARLSLVPAAVPESKKAPIPFKLVATLFVLALATLCALAWYLL